MYITYISNMKYNTFMFDYFLVLSIVLIFIHMFVIYQRSSLRPNLTDAQTIKF